MQKCFMLFLIVFVIGSAGNLFSNELVFSENFEGSQANWTASHPDKTAIFQDVGHTGQMTNVLLMWSLIDYLHLKYQRTLTGLDPEKGYMMTGWIKTGAIDFNYDPGTGWPKAGGFCTKYNEAVGENEIYISEGITGEGSTLWTKITACFKPGWDGNAIIYCNLGMKGSNAGFGNYDCTAKGYVYFDDIEVYELDHFESDHFILNVDEADYTCSEAEIQEWLDEKMDPSFLEYTDLTGTGPLGGDILIFDPVNSDDHGWLMAFGIPIIWNKVHVKNVLADIMDYGLYGK